MKPLDPKSHVAPKNILLATDFSPASEAALPHALGSPVTTGPSSMLRSHLRVQDLEPAETTATVINRPTDRTIKMEPLLSAVRQKGISCQPLIGEGAICDVLLDMIRQNDIDLMSWGLADVEACVSYC